MARKNQNSDELKIRTYLKRSVEETTRKIIRRIELSFHKKERERGRYERKREGVSRKSTRATDRRGDCDICSIHFNGKK